MEAVYAYSAIGFAQEDAAQIEACDGEALLNAARHAPGAPVSVRGCVPPLRRCGSIRTRRSRGPSELGSGACPRGSGSGGYTRPVEKV